MDKWSLVSQLAAKPLEVFASLRWTKEHTEFVSVWLANEMLSNWTNKLIQTEVHNLEVYISLFGAGPIRCASELFLARKMIG